MTLYAISRRYFRRYGCLPLHLAARLIAKGYDVPALEEKWSR